jgi:hypothetical protein
LDRLDRHRIQVSQAGDVPSGSGRAASRGWLWAAVALTAAKLWLASSQTVYAIGPAIHDDRLFVELAAHILNGEWLGPYTQFTLAKGPLFPLFIAAVFWLGLPLLLAQQILYAGASAAVTRALGPWVRPGAAQFALYTLLLWNPMSYDAGNLGRLMRQNLYTPLGLLVIAGLVQLFARRRDPWRRQAGPATLAGLSLGGFWLTREESVWLLPAVGLLLFGIAASLRRELLQRWRTLAASFALFALAALLPILIICSLNLRHYGWFGTVEFQSHGFKAAYGALTRLQVGPELPQVPVTREMREQAYELSPEFRRLRPYLEGVVGDNWSEKALFPAADRQIRGGWFIWAFRDSVAMAGIATDAGAATRYYQLVADELNAACDSGQVPARPPRSGFLPPLNARLIPELYAGTLEYGSFFLFFKNFTAHAPDSLGDYAELKPFRDLVGTRLSHAPRSPDPTPPNQSALDEWKLDLLENTGAGLGRLFGWLGPLVLLAGLVRALESLVKRRISFLLGLAGALLAACAAYLAINVLVHVTSFYNMSPAAMASAYPLYLIALAAIMADATQAWSRPVPSVAPAGPDARPSRWLWLGPAGAALVVFAARLREIHLYAGDVPYNDQWFIEARQIIAPWLDGTLRPWTFFTPHFEHLPVWTRLLAWLQVALTGRWDPLVQMTINAGLYALFTWLVARWVWRQFLPQGAAFVTYVLILGGALPYAWENIAWGFQSQFPFALLFLFVHVHGSCTHPPGSRSWWLAQVAGLAGLFTLASMWLAPLAVIASGLWVGRRERRDLAAPLTIVGLGIVALLIIHWQGDGHTFAQAVSPVGILHSALHLLGWPVGMPGALMVVQLPWLVHAFRIRGQVGTTAIDRIIFALGLWNCAQAAGLALARSGDTGDYVSRYGDILFIGVLAGALALVRLVPAAGRARSLFLAGGIVWSGFVTAGLHLHATEGHARYFHQTAAQSNLVRRNAVQAYLKNGDARLLEATETRWVLTQNPEVVTQLLDLPKFRALLPTQVNPDSPADGMGRFVRRLQSWWPGLFVPGLLVLISGLGLAYVRGPQAAPPAPIVARPDPWPGRLALAVGLISTGLLFLWASPLAFNQAGRWQQSLGRDQAVSGLSFAFAGETPFGPERVQGAAPLLPAELRNQFYGTAPAGPEFTGTVLSSAFKLTQPWLIVPFAGYPTGNGNGLRLRIVDDQGQTLGDEIGCPGPNLDGIAYWPVDVRSFVGRKAKLVLYDGRSDTEAWVAVAPPIPADSPELAAALAQRLQGEKHGSLHSSLGIIALVSLACAGLAWWNRRH